MSQNIPPDPQRDPGLDPYRPGTGAVAPTAASQVTPAEPASRKEAAKDQASEVKDTTAHAGREVVGEAKEQAGVVTAEARRQAGDLAHQAASELNTQAGQQQQRLASSLHGLSKQLGAMASGSNEQGVLVDLAHEGARRGGELAHWLENHEPGDVLDQVRGFARRRPGTFLLGAAVAGVLAGRLSRGIAQQSKNERQNGGHPQGQLPSRDGTAGSDGIGQPATGASAGAVRAGDLGADREGSWATPPAPTGEPGYGPESHTAQHAQPGTGMDGSAGRPLDESYDQQRAARLPSGMPGSHPRTGEMMPDE